MPTFSPLESQLLNIYQHTTSLIPHAMPTAEQRPSSSWVCYNMTLALAWFHHCVDLAWLRKHLWGEAHGVREPRLAKFCFG